jgi:hypothetical protein
MASTFSCDPWSAGEVARELAQVRAELASPPVSAERDAVAIGSPKIAGALHEFFSESSDSRARMGELLDRASGLLRGLSEGAGEVDRGLASALEPAAGHAR